MTLSTQAREYMAKRDELSNGELALISAVFTQIEVIAGEEFIQVALYDDRAAELEAALIKFIIDSRE